MKNQVKPIPEDFRTITPHLVVRGVPGAVEFYRRAFGAEELYRNLGPDGISVMHSELLLGDSRFFVNDEFPDRGVFAPDGERGTGVTLHLYVPDVDAFHARAVAAGVEMLLPLDNYFWGDRYFILKDPFGHRWSVASRIEDLSPEQIHERAMAFLANQPA
jgi:PhnB protein